MTPFLEDRVTLKTTIIAAKFLFHRIHYFKNVIKKLFGEQKRLNETTLQNSIVYWLIYTLKSSEIYKWFKG